MENTKLDWTKFTKRIIINKSIDEVYESWTKPSKIQKWFLEKAQFSDGYNTIRAADDCIKRKDSFVWKWHNWNFEETGSVLEANDKDLVSFTFGAGGKVTVKLVDKKKVTELILTQEDIPADDKSKMNLFVGCSTGWTFWLTNLKAYLEYGITLHAKGLKQEETTNLVNS